MRVAWRVSSLVAGLLTVGGLAQAQDVCSGNELLGSYGFQLWGAMQISPVSNPAAVLGRLTFGDERKVSGLASVNFNGYYLGNPVTGTYEVETNCHFTFALQDDSGAFQHFEGTVKPDGNVGAVHQSDPGAGGSGVLEKSPDACKAEEFHGRYAFTMSGVTTPLAPGEAGAKVSRSGVIDADGMGGFTLTEGASQTAGTYTVESSCFAEIDLPDSTKLRAVVVKEWKQVLAISTNPALTGTAKFTAEP
jgi:hypothetical protein